jgi:pyruvate/2-oxoglutarate dehydrogenase complex dihydrolipoamide acyltransferase (E2) component
MATEVVMPQMGADMEEGTLLRWLKHPGDHVARGEAIAEIETDKANVELEAFEEGVLERTLVEEGAVVPVGEPVAIIGAGACPDRAGNAHCRRGEGGIETAGRDRAGSSTRT